MVGIPTPVNSNVRAVFLPIPVTINSVKERGSDGALRSQRSTFFDGHPALQDELSGTEKGTNVVLLHTTVDDGDHFQTINAWTIKSRWQQQNEQLREITRTFRSEK
jgi:hypothetical protein